MERQGKKGYAEGEISLLDFLSILWKGRWVIIITTISCLILSLIYIYFAKPVYEARAYIFPPSLGDIIELNYARHSPILIKELPAHTTKEVYDIFIKHLLAESTKNEFFNNLMKLNEGKSLQKKWIVKSLSIKEIISKSSPAKKSPGANFLLVVRGNSQNQVAEWARQYIAIAKKKALNELVMDIHNEQAKMEHDLNAKIAAIKEITTIKREDRIQQLQEAIKVAKAIGMKNVKSTGRIITNASAVNDPSLMYLRGSIALEAELSNLLTRASSDAFAPDALKLRENQSLLSFFKKMDVSSDKIVMFKQDAIAKPFIPVGPRKGLILFLALFSGLMLGILLVMVHRALCFTLKKPS